MRRTPLPTNMHATTTDAYVGTFFPVTEWVPSAEVRDIRCTFEIRPSGANHRCAPAHQVANQGGSDEAVLREQGEEGLNFSGLADLSCPAPERKFTRFGLSA